MKKFKYLFIIFVLLFLFCQDIFSFNFGLIKPTKKKYEEVEEKVIEKRIEEGEEIPGDDKPSISITAPADDAEVSGTVEITVSASDDKGVTEVEFYIDDTLKHTAISTPYSYSWDTTAESDDLHTVKVIAYDTLNQTAYDEHTVTVNNNITFIIPYKTITFDGDWTSGEYDGDETDFLGENDPQGDDPLPYTGCDIKTIRMAQDSDNIYILLNMWDGAPNETWGQTTADAYGFIFNDGLLDIVEVHYDGAWTYGLHKDKLTGTQISIASNMEIKIPKSEITTNPFSLWVSIGEPDVNDRTFRKLAGF